MQHNLTSKEKNKLDFPFLKDVTIISFFVL